jgi:hypothetical protein
VTFQAHEAARFVHINYDTAEASRWTLEALALSTGYEGAVAYRSERKQLLQTEPLPASVLTEEK